MKGYGSIGFAHVTLSRRNLQALLAKLDGFPPDSAATITRNDNGFSIVVSAEEDDVHYADREAVGLMAPETEERIRQQREAGQ